MELVSHLRLNIQCVLFSLCLCISLLCSPPTTIHFIVFVPRPSRIAWCLPTEPSLPFWSSPCVISPLNFIVGFLIKTWGCNTREWQIVIPWLIVELYTRWSILSVTTRPSLNKSIFVTLHWQKRTFRATMFLQIHCAEIMKLDIYHKNVWMNINRASTNYLYKVRKLFLSNRERYNIRKFIC